MQQEYLVGGAVRDMLLGGSPTEFDYAFSGDAAHFLASHAGACRVGKSVRVCLWRGQEYMPLRGGSIESDLAARDLTCNALALDADGVLHSHPLALHDLRDKILRPASAHAFADDPVRAFRLARFAARFPAFSVHEEALRQMRALHGSGAVAALPAERVGRELLKALATPSPARFLRVLAAGGLLSPWFTELDGCDSIPAGPAQWHSGSVLEHTARVMNAVAGDSMAVWMALCHDLGKMTTPPAELPHHYQHEKRGEALALALAERLALSRLHRQAGTLAVRQHMKAGMYDRLRIGTCRDLLWATRQEPFHDAFWRMVDADSRNRHSVRAAQELTVIAAVRLPEVWQNRGIESARQLRELQCLALRRFREAQRQDEKKAG